MNASFEELLFNILDFCELISEAVDLVSGVADEGVKVLLYESMLLSDNVTPLNQHIVADNKYI